MEGVAEDVASALDALCTLEGRGGPSSTSTSPSGAASSSKTGVPSADSPHMRLVLDAVPSRVPLQVLIGAMGAFLTHEDGGTRRRATGVLAALLESAALAVVSSPPPSPSSSSSSSSPSASASSSFSPASISFLLDKPDTVRVLVSFFSGRLADYPSVLPALRALRALLRVVSREPACHPTAAVAVSRAIFGSLNTQTLDQAHRQTVFEVLEEIVTSDVHALALLGKPRGLAAGAEEAAAAAEVFEPYVLEFTSGFVQSLDQEKDPRCLLVGLKCAAALLQAPSQGVGKGGGRGPGWAAAPPALGDATGPLHAELLDVTGCYFPIAFTPPPNDPHGITKDQLVKSLRRVFSAHPTLAPHVIPLLLEKLGSGVPDAKRDALATLRAVAPVYGAAGLVPYIMDICSLLRKEVTQPRDRADPGSNAAGTATGIASLWTGTGAAPLYGSGNGASAPPMGAGGGGAPCSCSAGPSSSSGGVGVSAGAIGLNFSGAADLHIHSGYGLYAPLRMDSAAGGGGAASCASGQAAKPTPLVEEALHTIAAVTRVLASASITASQQQAGGAAPQWWTDYTAMMVRTGLTEIERSAESLMGRACARILCAFASASHLALRTVLDLSSGILGEIYDDAAAHGRHAARACLLACLAGLAHAVDPGIDHPAGDHPLYRHRPAMVRMFKATLLEGTSGAAGGKSAATGISAALATAAAGSAGPKLAGISPLTEARCIAAAGLCDLCVRPPTSLFEISEKEAITTDFTRLVLEDPDDTLREACLRALCTISSVRVRFCNAVLRLSAPRLLAVLRDGSAGPSAPSAAAAPASALASADSATLTEVPEHVVSMHAPGVAVVPARALYALTQLCAISALRVQLALLPRLVAAAVTEVAGAPSDGPPALALRGSLPGAASASAASASSQLHLSVAIVESLARLVSIKAGVDDVPAIDALLAADPEGQAAAAWAENQPAADSAASDSTPASPLPLLIPTLFRLVADSVRPGSGSSAVLPFRVRAAAEQIFRTASVCATAALQDSFRAAAVRTLVRGRPEGAAASVDLDSAWAAAAAAGTGGLQLPLAQWFAPLSDAASPAQRALAPILLKVIACSRRNAPVPHPVELALALCAACLRVPLPGPMRSCMDVTQRSGPRPPNAALRQLEEDANESASAVRAAEELGAGAARGEGAVRGGGTARGEGEGVGWDGGEEAGSASGAGAGSADRGGGKGVSSASASAQEATDLHRGAVLTAQCVGLMMNRVPSGAAGQPQLDALLAAVTGWLAASTGIAVGPAGAAAVAAEAAEAAGAAASAAASPPPGQTERERGLLVLVWVTKALAMRGHAAAAPAMDALLDCIEAAGAGAGAGAGVGAGSALRLSASALGCLVQEAAPRHPFSKEAGASSAPLYKQRLFGQVTARYRLRTTTPTPTDGGGGGGGDGAAAGAGAGAGAPSPPPLPLLLGLCAMAAHLPPALLATELERLLPVTVRVLELVTTASASASSASASSASASSMPPDVANAVALTGLSTLRALMGHPMGADALGPHLPTLVTALLQLGTYAAPGTGQGAGAGAGAGTGAGADAGARRGAAAGHRPLVRASALDCLRALVTPVGGAGGASSSAAAGGGGPLPFPYARLHPLRARVMAGLVPALDDPRRPVRRRAAACRGDWCVMAGGGVGGGGVLLHQH